MLNLLRDMKVYFGHITDSEKKNENLSLRSVRMLH